jgi:hypothetical protein
MHIRKSRNKIHWSIFDILLNMLGAQHRQQMASRCYSERDCSSNAKVIRYSLMTQRLRRTGWRDGRNASEETRLRKKNRDGSDS